MLLLYFLSLFFFLKKILKKIRINVLKSTFEHKNEKKNNNNNNNVTLSNNFGGRFTFY